MIVKCKTFSQKGGQTKKADNRRGGRLFFLWSHKFAFRMSVTPFKISHKHNPDISLGPLCNFTIFTICRKIIETKSYSNFWQYLNRLLSLLHILITFTQQQRIINFNLETKNGQFSSVRNGKLLSKANSCEVQYTCDCD